MHTLKLDASSPDQLRKAAQLLKNGKTVAFPTETVYGLGADATNASAVHSIFLAKNRPDFNPLIVHVHTIDAAWPLWDFNHLAHAPVVKKRIEKLAQAFWPGPLTLIAEKSKLISDVITGGSPKVAVRIPALALARQLIERAGVPIVAPSANLHTRPSPTSAQHVHLTLDGKIDAILDGGSCLLGIESTVVDVSGDEPLILRSGAISLKQLQELLPSTQMSHGSVAERSSPGMQKKHYSPLLPSNYLCDNTTFAQVWESGDTFIVRECTAQKLTQLFGERKSGQSEILPNDAAGFAAHLYGAFYRAELIQGKSLAIEKPPMEAAWDYVLDKLTRATFKD